MRSVATSGSARQSPTLQHTGLLCLPDKKQFIITSHLLRLVWISWTNVNICQMTVNVHRLYHTEQMVW
jgi:hypothetical protein